MANSQSLGLVFSTAEMHDRITEYVAQQLKAQGYADVSPSTLNFLSALDCGINYGSDIARRLQVSRQMVAKTVKELCSLGYLEQRPGKGKQKPIRFTVAGEQLMANVRAILAHLDEQLHEQVGEAALSEAITTLEAIVAVVTTELQGEHHR
jgi:DNA-binding MarR family transcriptional regulator